MMLVPMIGRPSKMASVVVSYIVCCHWHWFTSYSECLWGSFLVFGIFTILTPLFVFASTKSLLGRSESCSL